MNSAVHSRTNGPDALAPGPLFVVSMWRSGSSLLYALLNKHPQVALMYEADLMMLRPVFLKPRPFCDWAERWEFWNNAFSRHGLAPSEIGPGITDFAHAFATSHKLYALRHGARIWGDKSPNYYDRLNEMADDFPDARFIIVWRDPTGTANSILRAASLGNAYFSRTGAAFSGLIGYGVFKKECDRLVKRGQRVCQINYEDLIADTPSVMRRVCDFLAIPYQDSLSTLEGADRSALLDGQHHANLRSDTIVRGPRPGLIGADLKATIASYVAWWRQQYAAKWPAYPSVAPSVAPTTTRTRLSDRLKYAKLRARDRVSPIVFALAPLSMLRRFRERKARRNAGGQGSALPNHPANREAHS